MSKPLNFDDLGYPTVDTIRRAEAYYEILLDLITELRACPVLPTTREDLEPLRNMADRAEARLREVTDE